MKYLSPLRYPGGKARLATFVAQVISEQSQPAKRYVEPFAGGAGVALMLLLDEYVDEIVLNDLDAGIASFWRAVFYETEDFATMIQSARPTIKEWHRQREILEVGEAEDLALGFATFFLNRTNRSGILGARPIGGLKQTGKWGIGARYNAAELATRVQRLGTYASRVTVTQEDGIALAEEALRNDEVFLYADPPYLSAGDDLYLNALEWRDHERLATMLRASGNWLLTYDADPRIPCELYSGFRCASFDLAHTAAKARIGKEYAVFAEGLTIGSFDELGRSGGRLLSAG